MGNEKLINYSEPEYGVLTDFSREVNLILGDKSGRSVSRRTAHGIKNSFNLPNASDGEAENIAHGAMMASAGLLASRSEGAKACGFLLLLGLIACYQKGK